MDDGERRKGVNIIEYPENYEEMKKKYLEREEEKLQQVLARRKAESKQELGDIAKQALLTREQRVASEHKALKDRTILFEAKSEDIKELKQKLNEEIISVSQRIFALTKEMPSLETKIFNLKALKGRVSQQSTAQSETQKEEEVHMAAKN